MYVVYVLYYTFLNNRGQPRDVYTQPVYPMYPPGAILTPQAEHLLQSPFPGEPVECVFVDT